MRFTTLMAKNILNRPVRTGLTVVGLAVAIAAVILLVSGRTTFLNFRRTNIIERLGLLTLIILGEGDPAFETALAVAVHASSDLTAYSMDRLGRALETLLRRAVNAGVIRDDIGTEDILRTIVGLCYTHDKPGWQGNVLRLVDVFVEGMRRS